MGIRYFGILISVVSIFLIFEFPSAVSAVEGESIGSVFQCAHGFRGEVFVKNEREITIKGMNYDGKGPAAWFHGQLKGSKHVSSDGNYMTLPFKGTCKRLEVGRSYKDEDVSLILPISIMEFESIGIFCYQYCHNFGHIVIPKNLNVSAAPEDLQVPDGCPKPPYPACTVAKTRKGKIISEECVAGAAQLIPNELILIAGGILTYVFLTLRS